MKHLVLLIAMLLLPIMGNSQTLHSLIMINKEEPNRQTDRTAEMNNMSTFIRTLVSTLGYHNKMTTRSGKSFTSVQLESDLNNMVVSDNDIVVFYYSGHGVNWDDDEWPHMALLDRQYHATKVYNKLLEKFGNAKLILCIAACCNMDEEGRSRERKTYASLDQNLAKQLFTGFSGHRAYIASSSIRGQYSYSWSGGATPGAIYGISLREAIQDALTGKIKADWDYVFESAKQKTLNKTENKQMPQYSKKRW